MPMPYALKPGYGFLLDSDHEWADAPDDDWAIVIMPHSLASKAPRYVGDRTIDAAPCAVFTNGEEYYAQTQAYCTVGLVTANIRTSLGNTGCPECLGLGYSHFESLSHGYQVQRCDTCAPAWLGDEEASALHKAECGCDFEATGNDSDLRAVANKVFAALFASKE